MLKKTVIFLLCVLPMAAFAQDKLGHINTQEILMAMPELDQIETKMNELQTQWKSEMEKMQQEYFAKIQEFQEKQATMPESIKQARQSEIIEMEQRITTLNQTANSDLQQKQQEMLMPVIEKIKKAINEVGAENNYTYIFDLATQSIVYQSPKSNDITALVKKKLNLK
ncbi:OmpH family outer membrane protein [Paludibacter sp. 221]|uniref:OmpH family outer membrane protein n=1 Tax=Paludibacter sp. 221 TaxID=2302939 RepID=UPI0013D7CF63|nr:OmpH family outer membrane protein [Paludibacter sp. 221]NDV47217.1 OmpH family outer membrane protein [Paludibacter sp. 221]